MSPTSRLVPLIRPVMFRRLLLTESSRAATCFRGPQHLTLSSFRNQGLLPEERKLCFIPVRTMASAGKRDLFYDDIVKLSAKNEIILIDVREPAEIQETGKLPGSTHIPLGDVVNALSTDAATFRTKYGIEKPGSDAPIVFSCRSGKRSNTALEKALALGFLNCRHYAGGWLDWEKHTK